MPDTETNKISDDTEEVRLTGWGTFGEVGTGVKALLFGEVIKRAMPVIEQFHSDLFHDAMWIEENVMGGTSFTLVVRPSGTNLGESAQMMVDSPSLWQKGGVAYRVMVHARKGMWYATFVTVKDDRPGAITSTSMRRNSILEERPDGTYYTGPLAPAVRALYDEYGDSLATEDHSGSGYYLAVEFRGSDQNAPNQWGKGATEEEAWRYLIGSDFGPLDETYETEGYETHQRQMLDLD